jgi:hypothetical protein
MPERLTRGRRDGSDVLGVHNRALTLNMLLRRRNIEAGLRRIERSSHGSD